MELVESFSGIRGIYGIELTDEIARKYAFAYSEFLRKKCRNPRIVIGRDSRESGEKLINIFNDNLDCEIIDIGLMPTQVIENSVRVFNCDGGIVITASHNEPEYNGFKFLDKDGAVLRPLDIDFVIRKANEISNGFENKNARVINKEKEAMEEYKKFVKKLLKTDKIKTNFRFIVDPNGGAGIVSKEIFEEFGIKASYINMEAGKFNRLIEPNEFSLKYLEDEIKKQDAEFGLGFDCDADRVEILLESGELVSGNDILALIAEEIFSETRDLEKAIVVNDATSYAVKEISEKYNAKWIEVEVGEINVVDKMIEAKSQIGGEGSNGGIIIPPSKCRDGILTTLFLLKIISEKGKSLKELVYSLPKYYYVKEKIKIKEDFIFLREKIKNYYILKNFKILETGGSSGGLKAVKNNSWIWFRQSKTENKVLRIIADSKERKVSEELIAEAKNLVK